MNLTNELLAQTYPIIKSGQHGQNGISSQDLNLGLDLNELNFDLFDWSLYNFNDQSQSTSCSNDLNLNSSATFLNNNSNNYESTKLNQIQENLINTSSCDFDLELLDYNLLEASDSRIKSFDSNNLISIENSLFDLVNSPSDEVTYGNVQSIETFSIIEDDLTIMSSSVFSPASSNTDINEKYELKVKHRRTRARVIDKKESNKAAAIRYRTKKSKEKDQLFAECEEYAKKNAEMRKKISDCQTEISFIKSLLVEALIYKTGLSSSK